MKLTEVYKRILTSIILLPLIIFVIIYNDISFNLLLLSVLTISIYEWFNLNKKKYSISTLTGYFIISISFAFAFILKGKNLDDQIIFLWILFVCFFSDIGGYSVGKIVGGKKVTKISPNKTYSGVVGSFLFSLFPVFIFNLISNIDLFYLSLKSIFLSLLISAFCQLGDITVSYFKRKNKVKDTGHILPGHGGILDRIDGLIFVFIFMGVLKVFKFI
mgnify:CR=1 FL=1|tara:strand:- start:113 stop:763 length:651 start_codon:yes stop_codon:yes gene_type:complete